MRFPAPLARGRLLRRYKRFLADVELADGGTVVAHCANPGAMLGLARPGAAVWLSPAANPARKLRWSWELEEIEDGLVGINTARPNDLVEEGLRAGLVAELADYAGLRREVRYGAGSRIDLLLEQEGRPPCYLEVKNVHLRRRAALAEFPDSVTTRGAKHLRELAAVARQGGRAVMLYLVQRADCDSFALAADIDPAYADAFVEARAAGVEALCYACRLSTEEIVLDRRLPFAVE